jgi:hypothetical protein
VTPAAGARTVYALFADPDAAQRAVDGLRQTGHAEHEITVMSCEPFEEYEFSHRDSSTWLPWMAAAGGAAGLTLATILLVVTQNAWPIVTSGMPIVSWWPNLIIIFEMTMLGAILATVAALVMTAFVSRRARARFYDPRICDGYILVGIEGARDEAATVEVLASAGGRVERSSGRALE